MFASFLICRIDFDYVLLLSFKNNSSPIVISNQRRLERSLNGMASIEQAMSILTELGYMKVLQEEFDGNISNNDMSSCRKPSNKDHKEHCCVNINNGQNSSDTIDVVRHVRLYNLASVR